MFYETCVFVEIFEIAITIRKFDRDYKVILEQYYNTWPVQNPNINSDPNSDPNPNPYSNPMWPGIL